MIQGKREVAEVKRKQFSIFSVDTHDAGTADVVISKTYNSSISRAKRPAGMQTLKQ